MVRRPAVAGTFYPGEKNRLKSAIAEMIGNLHPEEEALAIIVPHAGYIYSGRCAAQAYGRIFLKETAIILGVDHYGSGAFCAIDAHQSWQTPLGEVPVDDSLRQKFSDSQIFKTDPAAGLREHSLEVQVPFLQYLKNDIKILPITFNSWNFNLLEQAGCELAEKTDRSRQLLIISTDFSHFIPAETAQKKDHLALQAIINLDARKLYSLITALDLSICGLAPLTVGLSAAKKLKASQCRLICYTNSGQVTGDFTNVVAYASLIIY